MGLSSRIKPNMGEEIDKDMNREKYLLLDSRVIKNTENVKLTLGTVHKDKNNPLFKEDKPWEPRFDNVYANVIYDEEDKLYKCWYNPFIIDEWVTSTPPEKRNPDALSYKETHRELGLCYAVSKDGIHWEKPDLGIVEFGGNKKNNIVILRGVYGAGVFKDLRERDPARRYKAFFSGYSRKIEVAFSPDGLHWSQPIVIPEVDAHGTHSNAFWAPNLDKYVGFTRLHDHEIRLVYRTESPDFVHWTRGELVFKGPNPREQAHDIVVFPAGDIYIGLLGMMEFPEDSNHHVKQHVELAWSPDTVTWHRIQAGTPLIGHSPGGEERYGNMPYDWGTIFASAPIFLDDETQIYYGASDWYFFDWRKSYLALATLRPDGWAGYEPTSTDTPAIITTKAVTGQFATLSITADVQVGGSVHVAVVDEQGKKLARSNPIDSTVTDGKVTWTDGWDLTSVIGKEILLKFELNDAKLYAYQFQGR